MRVLKLDSILVAVDVDDASTVALRTAEALSTASGAALHVVHVDTPRDGESGFDRGLIRHPESTFHRLTGDPVTAIQQLSAELAADVIVLGRHRHGVRPSNASALGGTALGVVTEAAAPCLVVGEPMRLPLQRVVAPVDLSGPARGALVIGLSWASALRLDRDSNSTTLTALYVDQSNGVAPSRNDGATRELDRQLDRLRTDAGEWASVAIEGTTANATDVADCLAVFAARHRADLVVMGTRGRGAGAERRLGSVAATLLGRTRAPVLLVPPAIWQQYSQPTSGEMSRS